MSLVRDNEGHRGRGDKNTSQKASSSSGVMLLYRSCTSLYMLVLFSRGAPSWYAALVTPRACLLYEFSFSIANNLESSLARLFCSAAAVCRSWWWGCLQGEATQSCYYCYYFKNKGLVDFPEWIPKSKAQTLTTWNGKATSFHANRSFTELYRWYLPDSHRGAEPWCGGPLEERMKSEHGLPE